MLIRGAALANRFYVGDGWTPTLIADLIITPSDPLEKLDAILLRLPDDTEGGIHCSVLTTDEQSAVLLQDDNCVMWAYYVVYESSVVFDRKQVEAHDYQPFSLSSGEIHECDQDFGQKNTWR